MGKKYLDLLERVGWTAIQSFAGVLVATEIVSDLDWGAVFLSAAIAAGISAAKCVVAFQFSNPDSAAFPETEAAPKKK